MQGIRALCAALVCFGIAGLAQAQSVDITRTNKTIAVTVSETVRVDPDLAIVQFGFRNYAKTKDLAFEENVRVSNRITKALLDAGIPKDQIETESIRVGDASPEWSNEAPKGERFEAQQTWRIRVAVPEAQKVIDLAVASGVNEVEDVNWTASDPLALEAKAGAAALVRAKELAQKMAQDMGVRLGELLYIGNSRPTLFEEGGAAMAYKMPARAANLPSPKLTLFPKQVERQATVHAVFSLE